LRPSYVPSAPFLARLASPAFPLTIRHRWEEASQYDMPCRVAPRRFSARVHRQTLVVVVATLCSLLLFAIFGQEDGSAVALVLQTSRSGEMTEREDEPAESVDLETLWSRVPLPWLCVIASLLVASSAALVAKCFLAEEAVSRRRCQQCGTRCVCGAAGASAALQVRLQEHASKATILSWVFQYGCSLFLIAVYVAADTGKMLLVGWANQGRPVGKTFLPSSLLLVQLLVSLALALGLTIGQSGWRGLVLATQPGSVAFCIPVAAFFFCSKMCTVAALGYVDAGTVKLSTQLILPCTASLSVWLLPGRGYSRDQWTSIFTICVGTLAFHAVQLEADAATADSTEQLALRREVQWTGLSLCGIVIITNSLGSVVGERFLKGYKDVPLVCLKAQLVIAEIFVVLPVLSGLEAPRGNWFIGWDWRVLVCALGWVPATWMSTIITARFSTVIKNVVQCVSTLVTYFLALMGPAARAHSPPATLLAFVVILSVFTFTLQSDTPSPPSKPSTPPDDVDLPSSQAAGRAITQPATRVDLQRKPSASSLRSLQSSKPSENSVCSPEKDLEKVLQNYGEVKWQQTWSAACGDLLGPGSACHADRDVVRTEQAWTQLDGSPSDDEWVRCVTI